MTIDFSVSPFFDDYQTHAKGADYHRILFVPGNAVQARELTQIQSILQEQIKRMGDSIFKNGTVVQPGHIYYDNTVISLKLTNAYGSVTVDSIGLQLGNLELTGSSGVIAHVLHYEPATATDPATIFVKYKSSNGTTQTFSNGEVLSSSDLNASVQISATIGSVGVGSIATITDGIYYINGLFVGVTKQLLVLDKYSNTPSYTIGLQFNESIVTSSNDSTLYDNALGFSNYAAPGGARYQINLTLTKKNLDFTDLSGQALVTFIPLLKVDTGLIQYLIDQTEYSAIEKMLARRTYDEAGDYVVDNFAITSRAYRNNNRGQWITSTPYITGDIVSNNTFTYEALGNGYSGTSAPTQSYGQSTDGGIYWLQVTIPKYNNGAVISTSASLQDHIADEAKMSIQISPGKAYVTGFEVNVPSKTSIVTDKARDSQQKSGVQIYTPSGSYALANTVTGIIDTGTMTQVNLLDPSSTIRGTAWATAMEYVSGTIGSTTSSYKIYLFNMQLQSGYDFNGDILTAVSTIGTSFACTFIQTTQQLSGQVTTAAASNVVSGKGTLFTQELKTGDQIQIGGVNKVVNVVVNDVSLTTSTTYSIVSTDVFAYALVVDLNNIGNYIQQLPNSYMRNMKTVTGTPDTSYTVLKTITFTSSGASATLTSAVTGETFDGILGHIVVNVASGQVINASFTLNGDATQLTIGSLSAATYKIIARVKRSGVAAREKMKTLTTKTIIATAANITTDLGSVITSNWNNKSAVISLTKCDVQRLIKVTMSGPDNNDGLYHATGESDVTSWYTLNTNNHVTHYDISTANRKSTVVSPVLALKMTFEYFEHSTGDFFSVDSYASVPYEGIPVETFGGITYVLRDCLDFRSRVEDDGLGFSGTGGNVSTPIYSNSTITTSYSYYLPRRDILTLNYGGTFEYFKGISSLNFVPPIVGDGSLQLADLFLDPYTVNTNLNVAITPTPHRRYTMQDINKIDQRLAAVEYYVALNELEKQTSSMQIYDSNGMSRFKNGFIADPFNSLDVCDVHSVDFRATIDIENSQLIPSISTARVPLVEPTGTTVASRISDGYQVTGDWITLPYTQVPLVSQTIATRDENINPFAVFSWNGYCKLSPQSDTWIDTVVTAVNQTDVGQTYTTNIWKYIYKDKPKPKPKPKKVSQQG